MVDIILVHRKSNQEFSALQSQFKIEAPVWKTCLRQIVFVHPEQWELFSDLNDLRNDEVYTDGAAVQFIVEVLCGLNSPNFGETEVFGQFKKFFQGVPKSHPLKRVPGLDCVIFKTVKEVRTAHLTQAGNFSYGQIIRRRLKNQKNAAIWGFGQLGQEIVKWLKEKDLNILVRNTDLVKKQIDSLPELGTLPRLEVMHLSQSNELSIPTVHVIAAPIADQEIEALLNRESTIQVIDLRGEANYGDSANGDSFAQHEKLVSLQALMKEIETLKDEQRKILPVCRRLIEERVQEFLQLAHHRPYCWEDLCG